MRTTTWRMTVAAAFAGAAWIAAAAPDAAAFAMRSNVIANGGSQPMTGGGRRIYSTLGQGAIGRSSGTVFTVCHGFWCLGGSGVVSIPHDPGTESELPKELAFGAPTPNPSRGDVRFTLALPEPAEVTFTVYDVAGRQVGDPVLRRFEAGYHRLQWSAPANHAGVYFGRLAVDGAIKASRRLILVR